MADAGVIEEKSAGARTDEASPTSPRATGAGTPATAGAAATTTASGDAGAAGNATQAQLAQAAASTGNFEAFQAVRRRQTSTMATRAAPAPAGAAAAAAGASTAGTAGTTASPTTATVSGEKPVPARALVTAPNVRLLVLLCLVADAAAAVFRVWAAGARGSIDEKADAAAAALKPVFPPQILTLAHSWMGLGALVSFLVNSVVDPVFWLTVGVASLDLLGLFIHSPKRFLTSLVRWLDVVVLMATLHFGWYLNMNGGYLFSLFRLYRAVEYHELVLSEIRVEARRNADQVKAEKKRVNELTGMVEQANAKWSRESQTRERAERLMNSYRSQVQMLEEALAIAAQDTVLAAESGMSVEEAAFDEDLLASMEPPPKQSSSKIVIGADGKAVRTKI